MTVIILRGYPASGKSTWANSVARQGGHFIVNRDTIRTQLTGTSAKQLLPYESEQLVSKIAQAQAREAIKAGLHVIIDATNLRRKHAVWWANLAYEMGVGYKVLDFEVSAEECIKRDNSRTYPVGSEVIEDYAERFPIKTWPLISHNEKQIFRPYVRDSTKKQAVIFDLDGTLADMNGRDPYDASTCADDLPREAVLAALEFVPPHVEVIFLSGRSLEYYEETASWLHTHTGMQVHGDKLFMRASGDNRQDALVKSELFDRHIAPNYNVLFIYDDRDQVVDMWRQKGLDCFQVAPGDF